MVYLIVLGLGAAGFALPIPFVDLVPALPVDNTVGAYVLLAGAAASLLSNVSLCLGGTHVGAKRRGVVQFVLLITTIRGPRVGSYDRV